MVVGCADGFVLGVVVGGGAGIGCGCGCGIGCAAGSGSGAGIGAGGGSGEKVGVGLVALDIFETRNAMYESEPTTTQSSAAQSAKLAPDMSFFGGPCAACDCDAPGDDQFFGPLNDGLLEGFGGIEFGGIE